MVKKSSTSKNKDNLLSARLWQCVKRKHTMDLLKKYLENKETQTIIGTIEIDLFSVLVFQQNQNLSSIIIELLKQYILNKFPECLILDFGYERLIIAVDYDAPAKLNDKFSRILNALNKQVSGFTGKPIKLDLKVGVSSPIKKISDFENAIGEALTALYETKKYRCVIASSYEKMRMVIDRHHSDMEMASYFLRAMNRKKLKLAYQPVIDAKTGKNKSFEALLRIETDEGAIISAGPFIGVAEKFGFISDIDIFSLNCAAEELHAHPEVVLAVNVSKVTLETNDWINFAKKTISPDIAGRMIIEVTETGVNDDLQKIAELVDTIKAMGCKVAIDDFGAGYTSFKQLKLLNADILKIDGVFIRDIAENPDSQLFVQTLLEFSKAYHLKTVAEFVETGEIARILLNLGIDYMQGYYFGQPVVDRPWQK